MTQLNQPYTSKSSPKKPQAQAAHFATSSPSTPTSSRRPIIQHRHNTRHQHKQVEQFLKDESSPVITEPATNPLEKLAVAASERVEETAAAQQILQMTASTSTTTAQGAQLGPMVETAKQLSTQPKAKHAKQETAAAQQMLQMSVAQPGPAVQKTIAQPSKQPEAPVNTLPPPEKASSSAPSENLKVAPTDPQQKSSSLHKQQTTGQQQVKATSSTKKPQVQQEKQVRESKPTPPPTQEKSSSSPPANEKVPTKEKASQPQSKEKKAEASSSKAKEGEKETSPPVSQQQKAVEPAEKTQKPSQMKTSKKQGVSSLVIKDNASAPAKEQNTSKAMTKTKSLQSSAHKEAKQSMGKPQKQKAGSSTEKSSLYQKDNEEAGTSSESQSSSQKKSSQVEAGGQAKDRPDDVTAQKQPAVPKAAPLTKPSSKGDQQATPVAQIKSQVRKEQVKSTQAKSLEANRQKGVNKNPSPKNPAPPGIFLGFKGFLVSKKKIASPANKTAKNQNEMIEQVRKERPSSSEKEKKDSDQSVDRTQTVPHEKKALSTQKQSLPVTQEHAKVKPSESDPKIVEVVSAKEKESPLQQQPKKKQDKTPTRDMGVDKTPHGKNRQSAQKNSKSMKSPSQNPKESKVDQLQKQLTSYFTEKGKVVLVSKLKQGEKRKARESAQDEQPQLVLQQNKQQQATKAKSDQVQQPRRPKVLPLISPHTVDTKQPTKTKQRSEQEMVEAVRQASLKSPENAGRINEEKKSAGPSQEAKVTKPQHEDLKSSQQRSDPMQQKGGNAEMEETTSEELSSRSDQKQPSSSKEAQRKAKHSTPKPQSEKDKEMLQNETLVDERSKIESLDRTRKNEEHTSVRHKAMDKHKVPAKPLSKASLEQEQQAEGKEKSCTSKPQHQSKSDTDQEKPLQNLSREKLDQTEKKEREATNTSPGREPEVRRRSKKRHLLRVRDLEETERVSEEQKQRSLMEERRMKGPEGLRRHHAVEKTQQSQERRPQDNEGEQVKRGATDKVEVEAIAVDKQEEGSKSLSQHKHNTRRKHRRKDEVVDIQLNESVQEHKGVHDVAARPVVHGLRKKPAPQESETKASSEEGNEDHNNQKRKAASILTPSELYATLIKDSAQSATAKAVMKLRRATLNVDLRQRGKGRTKKKRRRSKNLTISEATKKLLVGGKVAINPMLSSPESSLLIDLSFGIDDSSPNLSGTKSPSRTNKQNSSSKAQLSSSHRSSAKQDQLPSSHTPSTNSHSPKKDGSSAFSAKSNSASASIHVEGSASSQSSKKLKRSTPFLTSLPTSTVSFNSPASILGSASSQTSKKQSSFQASSASITTMVTQASSKTISNNGFGRHIHSSSSAPTLPAKKRAMMGLEPTQVSKKPKRTSPVSVPDSNIVASNPPTLPTSTKEDQSSSTVTSHSSSLPPESKSFNETEIGKSLIDSSHLTKDDNSKSSDSAKNEEKESLSLKARESISSRFGSKPSDISLHFTQWQNKLRQRKAEGKNVTSSRSPSPKAPQSDGSASNSNSNLRRSTRHRPEEVEVPVGQVGFKFEKFFPGHGLFNGMVVEIIGKNSNNSP